MKSKDKTSIKNYLKHLADVAYEALERVEKLDKNDKAKIRQMKAYKKAFKESIDKDLFSKE